MKDNFKRSLLITSSIIVGSAVVAAVVIYFLSNDLAAQVGKIVEDKAFAAQQAAALTILANLKADVPVATTYTTAMEKLLPTHDELIGVPQWINTTASADGVAASFSFQGSNVPASASAAGTDTFSLSVQGPIANITSFLNDIETKSSQFLLSVTNFDLVASGSGYTLSVQGVVYSRASS